MDSLKLTKGGSSTSSSSANNAAATSSTTTTSSSSTSLSTSSAAAATSSTNKSSSSAASSSNNSSSTSTNTTVPITVRFNAGDECIDDLFQSFHSSNTSTTGIGGVGGGGGGGGSNTNLSASGGGIDSLSTSPSSQQQQHHPTSLNNPDEVNTRNNFLQGNFFNRKRSGSIEGVSPTSVGPNLIQALSGSDATSMGTWKMIKGKVSQTIEDIKSSKGSNFTTTTMTPPVYPTVVIKAGDQQQTPAIEFDSDQETKTSISEDLSMEHDRRSSGGSTKQKRSSKLEDSDTDFENEILLEGDSEHSRLRRGFAHLKSKVKAKHEAHQAKKTSTLSTATVPPTAIRGSVKKDTSPSRSTGSSSSSTSLRGNFLRRRRNKGVDPAEQASPTNISPVSALAATVASGEMAAAVPVVVSGKPSKKSSSKSIMEGEKTKKDVEIESGVEMLEDMIPPVATHNNDENTPSSKDKHSKRDELDLPLSQTTTGTPSSSTTTAGHEVKVVYEHPATITNVTSHDSPATTGSATATNSQTNGPNASTNSHSSNLRHSMTLIVDRAKSLPLVSIFGLILILILPIHDFIRGVLACILSISIIEAIWQFIQNVIEYFTISIKPEKRKFQVPDYSKMSICEVPAVEEFKTVKSYGGWMNEVDSYDPNTFHISMTRPVYIKLEGSILHISNTNARIPKRAMWNEPPIDRKSIIFTTHRSYNLLGCRIELLPIGLARKRHFNRKYPIQLIVKPYKEAKNSTNGEVTKPIVTKHRRFSRHRVKAEKPETKEIVDPKQTQMESAKTEAEIDFGATIMNADLQKLQDDVNPDEDLNAITVPCGDEVRILLFARGAREKEDWYRRFVCASNGDVNDQDLHLSNVKLVDDKGLQAAATRAAQMLINPKAPEKDEPVENEDDFVDVTADDSDSIEGLLMTSGAARNDADYIKFMSLYQNACRQSRIPVYKGTVIHASSDKRSHKRTVRHENELWKGIDQSLFLGPSGSVVWANVLVGRLLFSSLQNEPMLEKLQDILQKKLNSIKLPSFMEDVIIKNIDLGDKPPLLHRVSQPLLDERGLWLDMDVTYEGLCQITVTTKLNLLRLKRPARSSNYMGGDSNYAQMSNSPQYSTLLNNDLAGTSDIPLPTGSAIYDSDAESTGSSSTESEGSISGSLGDNPNSVNEGSTNPGNARRIFKFVDRIATSNFFQYATELSYVQRAMENMSTTITLGIDLHGLVSRVTINMPPPPSDRIWLAFRAPPRLWLTARPTVGDKSVDWSIVTNVIEGKLCEAVNKYLVYPNMVDLTVPLLGKSATND
ncbi:uncharacterized protein LOC133331557 [Musca vetustissima]|uniref:uncharacterized protein LOC133331557 n=1 Tax=Musca vetustissima TaxID=27455 RepID=UPI002AB78B25|nr:uncharacterized protein LOC133331557 [Musca vetustissima]